MAFVKLLPCLSLLFDVITTLFNVIQDAVIARNGDVRQDVGFGILRVECNN